MYLPNHYLYKEVSNLWERIKNNEFNKKSLEEILARYSTALEKDDNLKNEQKYEISLKIIDLYQFVLMVGELDPTFERATIILKEKDKDLYYLFHDDVVKTLATNIDWFFPAYQKAEIVKSKNKIKLIKEKKRSNLIFAADFIFNSDLKIIYINKKNKKYYEDFVKNVLNKRS